MRRTLTFMVFSPETNDWLDVRRLSQGTLDQLYLCARLGIVRQVTQPAEPPLVFDDPFITFDDERAKRAVALLKDIARDHQVIYLTTSDRYDELADNVVELPAPTERDEPDSVGGPDEPAETLTVWPSTTLPEPVGRVPRAPRATNGSTTATQRRAGKRVGADGGAAVALGRSADRSRADLRPALRLSRGAPATSAAVSCRATRASSRRS